MKKNNIPVLDINKAVLSKEIQPFLKTDSISDIQDLHFCIIIYNAGSDTVEYHLHYFLSPSFLKGTPIAFFMKINNILAPVVLQGIMFRKGFLFEQKQEVIEEYVKTYFPVEFKYYKNTGEYPIPKTRSSRCWVLKFKEDKFIEKYEKED